MATGLTTNYNIPYPVSTDPVNVHSDIQSLAVSVDTLFNSGVTTSKANAFTNTNTFSANSASSAITITQTGAGNALTVEDSSPDSTPFIINASGNVGIGKTTASVPLDVVGAGTFTGTVTANDFSGSGASLTSLNGTNISSGTVAAARIDTAIARVATPTFTGTVILPTGGTVSAPLKFIAGTNLTTPVAGSVEYDGAVATITPSVNFGRAPIATPIFTSGVGTSGIAATTNYALFPAAVDTITLPVGTYMIQASIRMLVATSTTSLAFNLNARGAGTAVGTMTWDGTASITDGGAANEFQIAGTALGTNIAVSAASAVAGRVYLVRGTGILKVTTAGTIIPAYQWTATNTSGVVTLYTDNYMMITPLASSSVTSTGAWG